MAKKIKPFRVSYYDASEIENGRAPVRSIVVEAESPITALAQVSKSGRTLLRCYPFYRKYQEPRRKTWVIVSGPKSPATQEVLRDLTGMVAHDGHERIMDTFKPSTENHLAKFPAECQHRDKLGHSPEECRQQLFPEMPRYAICSKCGMSDVYYKRFNVPCPKQEQVTAPQSSASQYLKLVDDAEDLQSSSPKRDDDTAVILNNIREGSRLIRLWKDLGHESPKFRIPSICTRCGMSFTYATFANATCPNATFFQKSLVEKKPEPEIAPEPLVMLDEQQSSSGIGGWLFLAGLVVFGVAAIVYLTR